MRCTALRGLFYWPAHLGDAVKEFYLVLIGDNKEELLQIGGWVPSHAHRYCALLHTLGAQNEKFVWGVIFQVILHLSIEQMCKTSGFKTRWKKWRYKTHKSLQLRKPTNWTDQTTVHSQREQPGSTAVWVKPKKNVFDGLVVGVVPANKCPRTFFPEAKHRHSFSSILMAVYRLGLLNKALTLKFSPQMHLQEMYCPAFAQQSGHYMYCLWQK